jgi:hypothetical protein
MLFRTQFVIWTIKRVIVLLCCVIAFLGLFVLSITNQTEDLTNLLRSKPMWQIVEKEPDWGKHWLFFKFNKTGSGQIHLVICSTTKN